MFVIGTEIYYFSGTGNSLVVARDIAKRLDGKMIPVASVIAEERIRTDADVIGIVFPVHNVVNGGVPPIIRRFVTKLEGTASTYIFVVCTCGAGSGDALKNVGKIIKSNGSKLAAGFTVKMPFNCPPFTKSVEQQKRFHDWNQNLAMICEFVTTRKKRKLGTLSALIRILTYPLGSIAHSLILNNYRKLANAPHLPFDEAVSLIDRSHCSDEKCNGCGTCASVCPVSNIEMINNRPEWQHNCSTCLSCFVWCPQKAIYGGLLSGKEERYHHPDVTLLDMLKQRSK